MEAPPPEPRELTSWKEIADRLGVTVRTAQNWERDLGLPARHLPGPRGRVSALAAELDRWKAGTTRPRPSPARRRWCLAGAALAAFAAALLAGMAWMRPGPPESFRFEPKSFLATDGRGREIWRKTFPEPLRTASYTGQSLGSNRKVWIGDLDGDGRRETLLVYSPVTHERDGEVLYCFAETGEETWRFTPGKAVSTGPGREYASTYYVGTFLVMPLETGGPPRVIVTSHHATYYPNQVAVLDHSGVVRGEYWHSGQLPWLQAADLDDDGRTDIVLAGISNSRRRATLVVLDGRDVRGASAEPEPYQLQGMEPARERARVFFPRTCIGRRSTEYNAVAGLGLANGTITIGVREYPFVHDAIVNYQLTGGLEVAGVDFFDALRGLHRELEQSGHLDHRLTEEEVEGMKNLLIIRGPI